MTHYIVKTLLTLVLIVAITEASKRSTFFGGLVASLPLISILAITWLYFDTRDTARVAALSTTIFWLVLPSLVFFLLLPAFLGMKLHFALSLSLSTLATAAAYFATVFVLSTFKVKL